MFLSYQVVSAQTKTVISGTNNSENMMRSNGMIYVVVGVIVIILLGLILYLISIDRKLGRLEKEIKENK
ncbi:MAG: CcmD family protein [Chitinophagales bacterium]